MFFTHKKSEKNHNPIKYINMLKLFKTPVNLPRTRKIIFKGEGSMTIPSKVMIIIDKENCINIFSLKFELTFLMLKLLYNVDTNYFNFFAKDLEKKL